MLEMAHAIELAAWGLKRAKMRKNALGVKNLIIKISLALIAVLLVRTMLFHAHVIQRPFFSVRVTWVIIGLKIHALPVQQANLAIWKI